MYDPVRNQVEKGNYITEKFKEKVWATIKHLLSTSDCINYSNKDLYQMWMDLGRLAKKENRFEIGTKIFEIIVSKNTNFEKVDSLNEYAYYLGSVSKPNWETSIKTLQEALSLLVEEQKEERTTALHILAYCLISKPDPDWEYAIKTTQEELSLLEEEKKEEREKVLHNLAYCLRNKPDPDWEYAIKVIQEELGLLEEEKKEERMEALHNLAECFSTKSESDINDYDKADEMHRKALEIEPDNTTYIENYAIFLKNIRKDYDKADEMYRKALEI
jgi:tetratricopeptide (TPR) repeat protein